VTGDGGQRSVDDKWLYVFTSTLRPLYVDDAVTVLGAAAGTRHRFRYADRHVADELADAWGDGLVGRRVAVHLSIQHPAGYHEPVYVPLRAGTVTDARREGSMLIVEFTADGFLAIARPDDAYAADGDDGRKRRAAAVQNGTDRLLVATGREGPRTGQHAVLGQAPLLPPHGQDDGLAFQQLAAYVSEALHYTPRLLARVAQLWDEDDGSEVHHDPKTGVYPLRAGRRYTVVLVHQQREQPADGTVLTVSVPPPLAVLGDPVQPVSSRYDVIPVQLFAAHRDDFVVGEISVALTGPTPGPSLRMTVSVMPGAAATVGTPLLGGTAAALVLFPPILSGGDNVPLRLTLATLAALAAGLALRARRSRGLPG